MNLDHKIERSRSILEEIKLLTKERESIAKEIGDFLVADGKKEYRNGNNVAVLYSSLSPKVSDLNIDQKSELMEWAINNYPQILQINNTALINLIDAGVNTPIDFSQRGYTVRVWESHKDVSKKTRKEPVSIAPKSKPTEIIDPWTNKVPEVVDSKSKTLADRERLALMQAMWDDGETLVAIGKTVGLYPSYVKKKLRPHINKMMRELRKEVKERRQT